MGVIGVLLTGIVVERSRNAWVASAKDVGAFKGAGAEDSYEASETSLLLVSVPLHVAFLALISFDEATVPSAALSANAG